MRKGIPEKKYSYWDLFYAVGNPVFSVFGKQLCSPSRLFCMFSVQNMSMLSVPLPV